MILLCLYETFRWAPQLDPNQPQLLFDCERRRRPVREKNSTNIKEKRKKKTKPKQNKNKTKMIIKKRKKRREKSKRNPWIWPVTCGTYQETLWQCGQLGFIFDLTSHSDSILRGSEARLPSPLPRDIINDLSLMISYCATCQVFLALIRSQRRLVFIIYFYDRFIILLLLINFTGSSPNLLKYCVQDQVKPCHCYLLNLYRNPCDRQENHKWSPKTLKNRAHCQKNPFQCYEASTETTPPISSCQYDDRPITQSPNHPIAGPFGNGWD